MCLVGTLIQATSDCLHTCLMSLPENYHSLVTEVYHPRTPPSQIAHISSSQLTLSHPRWMTFEGRLLKLCRDATSRTSLSVLHCSFDDGSYLLLQNSAACGVAPEHQSASSTLKEGHAIPIDSSFSMPHRQAEDSNALLFDRAVCCLCVDVAANTDRCPAARDVAHVLPQVSQLSSLEIRSASKQDVYMNPHAQAIQSTLELCTGLRSLSISGICSEDECRSTSPLVPALMQLNQLQSLALTDHSITSQTLTDLQELLTDPSTPFLPNLKSLNLSRNRLWYLGVYPLHSLLTRLTTIEEIDLSGSLLGIEIFGRYALSDAFRALKSLRTIRMSSNRLHGEVLRPLARAWGTLHEIEHLDLKYSCIRYTMDIAFSLSWFSGLQHLDLSGATQNDVTSWSVLTSALQPLNSLTHLSLQSCQLSTAAMALLLPSIASCTKLLILDLSENEKVTSKGIQCLSEHIFYFPLLTSLRLSCFDPSGTGARALALALPLLRHLNRLDLTGFCTCDAAAIQLQSAACNIGNVACPRIIDSSTSHPYPSQPLKIPMLHMD